MYERTLLYIACILAGFALANVPVSSVINAGIASFLEIIGGAMIIIFGLALLYIGIKKLFSR